jgi:hypothetical protein
LGASKSERGLSVPRLEGVEARVLEVQPANKADRRLVVDDQDATGARPAQARRAW